MQPGSELSKPYSFTAAWLKTQLTLYSFTAAWLRIQQHTDTAYAVISAGVDGVMPKTFQLRFKTIVFVTCGFLKPLKFSTLIEIAPLTDLVLSYCLFLACIKIVFFLNYIVLGWVIFFKITV